LELLLHFPIALLLQEFASGIPARDCFEVPGASLAQLPFLFAFELLPSQHQFVSLKQQVLQILTSDRSKLFQWFE
jgi:hypothetical protein